MSTPAARPLAETALTRFGFGPRPGDLAAASSDPRGYLLDELSRSSSPPGALPSSQQVLQQWFEEREAKKAKSVAPAPGEPMRPGEQKPGESMRPGEQKPEMGASSMSMQPRQIFVSEAAARLGLALTAPAGFHERLVVFWSNHLCISTAKGAIFQRLAGPYEREVVRPHVLGRFEDMLIAAVRHPAMIMYLDNVRSMGPNSRAGLSKRGRGLNENLAREILELHTVGVDGGYAQNDVSALAAIISGWTIGYPHRRVGVPGQFFFNPAWHEPGDQTVLGRRYPAGGPEQGEQVLRDLARKPATAKHIAVKFARHFVADEPDRRLVQDLERVFMETGGDLGALARALIMAPAAWESTQRKVRSPYEFVVAAIRGLALPHRVPGMLGFLHSLGQPIWQPPGPNGFGDTVAEWATPEGLRTRLDVATALGQQAIMLRPLTTVSTVLGKTAAADTLAAVKSAESSAQAHAIMLMAPEFQRR